MNPTICDPAILVRALKGELSELEDEQLATHLEQCEQCRDQLEALSFEEPSWKKIESVLRNETMGHEAPDGSRSTLIPASIAERNQLHSIGVDIQVTDFAVEFLQPTKNSEALGQLDDIQVQSIIGHGGNGIVLKGHQEDLKRLVAVKVMAPQLATSTAARKRFAREAQATAAIVHPNVMPILSVQTNGQLPYLVMPFVNCESLQERIDRDGALPLLDILRIGHQVAKGLAAAHAQGLVHRDVKPANILLEKGVDRVMLTDFGLARAVDDGTLTRTGLIAGTPQYMSPEQARGEAVDTRSDLFSLGSVLYAMCTGRPPFRAETTYGILKRVIDEPARDIADLNGELPCWASGYVSQLMSKSAAARVESAEQIARTLERCVAHIQQPEVNPLPENVRPFQRRSNRILLVGIAATALFALCIAAVMIFVSGLFSKSTGSHSSANDAHATAGPALQTDNRFKPPKSGGRDAKADDAWHTLDRELRELDEQLNALSDQVGQPFADDERTMIDDSPQ